MLKFRFSLLLLCVFGAASLGHSQTAVYYSVGTDSSDLKNGPVTLDLSAGTATFSVAQPVNIGVGDEVTYGGTNTVFISGRISPTVYRVQTAIGGVPADVAGATVDSIMRAFNSLTDAEANSSDSAHLDTSNLVTGDYQLNWSCYDDTAMNDTVEINGYTTGANNYIHIYTPTDSNEVGVSQRHHGKAGTGFRLVPVTSTPPDQLVVIRILDDDVRITGIELDGSGVTNARNFNGIEVDDAFVSASADLRFDKLIIHDLHNSDGSGSDADVYGLDLEDGNVRLSNTIIYDLAQTTGLAAAYAQGVHLQGGSNHYLHNNTIFNIKNTGSAGTASGVQRFGGTVAVSNTVVLDVVSTSGSETCFAGTLTQSNNVSSDGSAVGSVNQTAYATYFQNITDGSEDFHLKNDSFALWGSYGADLDSDPNLPITNDIDGGPRDAANPDMGADEFVETPLYRSVGITVTDLNTSSRTVEVTGTSATFSGPMPSNIGVGDVLQYQVAATTYLAFIHGRTSEAVYTVQSSSGGPPQVAAAGTSVEVFRAYTSLFNWESQNENDSFDDTVENFDTSADLVTNRAVMNVACYGDGADTTAVVINGWVTAPDNFIRIFTPTSTSEVGISQRHRGIWDLNAYRLEVGGSAVLRVEGEYVRVDGLQVRLTTDTSAEGIFITGGMGSSYYEVSNNVIRGNGVGVVNNRYGLNLFSAGSGVMKAWNNVIYDWDGGSSLVSGLAPDDAGFTFYLYNNTVVDCAEGISRLSGTVVAKNNLSYSNTDNYSGIFDATSTNNLSGPVQSDAPGSNPINAAAVTFVDEAGDDFHLAPGDTGAQDLGADLSSDSNLAFSEDIDKGVRTTPWDIGADDVLALLAANMTQVHYRWRNDDEGESGSSTIVGEPANWNTFDSVNTVTVPYAVGAGPNRLLLVGVSFNNGGLETVSAVTWKDGLADEQSFAKVDHVDSSNDARVEIWSLVAPNSGSGDIRVTFDNVLGDGGVVGVKSFTGVDQTTPLGTFASAWQQNDPGPAQVVVVSAPGELVFDTAACEDCDSFLAAGGQTEEWNTHNADRDYGAGSTAPGAPSVTMSWTLGQSAHWAVGAVPIKPALGTGASWAAAEDTKLIGLAKNNPKRVRFEVSHEGGMSSVGTQYQLQVAETANCALGIYTNVSSDAHWQLVNSSFFIDGDPTSNIPGGLTDEASTFVSGELKDASDTTSVIVLDADQFTEIEYAVRATGVATDGGDYCFRLYDATNNQVIDTYSAYAEVSLALGGGPVDLTQIHYRWRNDDAGEGSANNPVQVSATDSPTTSSSIYVLVPGISATPGAGDYHVWFSGSLEADTASTQYVSIYLNGSQIPHTERELDTEGSITDTPRTAVTHAKVTGLVAADTVEARWRTSAGIATMHERTLVITPINPTDVAEVAATGNDTTTSVTYSPLSGMSMTPSAGDYLVWFSGSIKGSLAPSEQYVSLFVNGNKVAHTERLIDQEDSLGDTYFPVAFHARLTGVAAGAPIEVRWKTPTAGNTATMAERTLTLSKVTAAETWQAEASLDDTTTSATYVQASSMSLTPGTGNYLVWFSSSLEGNTSGSRQYVSLFVNGTQVAHSEREFFVESSLEDTLQSFPAATHAYVTGVGATETIEVRWRTIGGTATMHQRALAVQKITGVAGSTWAAGEDIKLIGLVKNTPKRVRFEVSNEGDLSSGGVAYRLQVAEAVDCSLGVYADVSTDLNWELVDSPFFIDADPSFNVAGGLTDEEPAFVAGELRDISEVTGPITLAANTFTEIEFAVQATGLATDGGNYCFRLYDVTNSQILDTYAIYAEVSLAISGIPDLTQIHYRWRNDDGGEATATWATSQDSRLIGVAKGTSQRLRFEVANGGTAISGAATYQLQVKEAFSCTPGGYIPVPNDDSGHWKIVPSANFVDGDPTTNVIPGLADEATTFVSGQIKDANNTTGNITLNFDEFTEIEFSVQATANATDGGHYCFQLFDAAGASPLDIYTVYAAASLVGGAAPTVVFYSVGTDTGNLMNGPVLVDIIGGTATFNLDQPDNIGVGDEVTYDDGGPTKVYISGRIGPRDYTVRTQTGGLPTDVVGANVFSITRAFNSLTAATIGSADVTHLGTPDLVANNFQLHWACYNDGPDPSSQVKIEEPWVTGPDNYIRVFTPTATNQVGSTQRHNGIAGTGYRIVPSTSAPGTNYEFIELGTDYGYVRVEGIEIDGSGVLNGESMRVFEVDDDEDLSEDCRISHCLIHDIANSTVGDSSASDIEVMHLSETRNAKVWNNFIYDITNVSTHNGSTLEGIEGDKGDRVHYIYGNTLYNIRNTGSIDDAKGIDTDAGCLLYVKNNYAGLVESTFGTGWCFKDTFASESNNVSSDDTALGPGSQINMSDYASYFVNTTGGGKNLHLKGDSFALWGSYGADLDSDPDLPVTDDIDGEARDTDNPDIGADEYSGVSSENLNQTHYRWRNDDGDETTATWSIAEDTRLFGLPKNTTQRIRFEVANEGGASSGAVAYKLQFAETATCSSGSYTDVPTGSSDHWQIVVSTFFLDGDPTTNVAGGMTDEGVTFVAGEIKDSDNTTNTMNLNPDEFTEVEFSVLATDNATDGGNYCFRLFDPVSIQSLDTYTVYAEVSLSGGSGATLALADHDSGQVPDRFTTTSPVIDTWYRFKLARVGTVTVEEIRLSFTTGGGVANSDVALGELWQDTNGNGTWDDSGGGDTLIGAPVVPVGGVLRFSTLAESPSTSGTGYFVRAIIGNLVGGDTTTFSVGPSDIDVVEGGIAKVGSITDAVHLQDAGNAIYYSVGTDNTDLKNGGALTMDLSSGIATFSLPQPDNIGLGDEVTYSGTTKVYITGRVSPNIYTVQTATGSVPADMAGAPVTSITRAFNSLNAAVSGSSDLFHLNTVGLIAGDYQLNWVCYDDAPMDDGQVVIDGYNTGPAHYIRVFTPTEPSEVGVSQRHDGTAGTGFRLIPLANDPGPLFNFLRVSTDNGYVRIEGIEIDGTNVTLAENVRGIRVDDLAGTSEDVRISECLVHDITNSIVDDGDESDVYGIQLNRTDHSKVFNNIIYNLNNVSANSSSDVFGIESDEPGKMHDVYNNTVYNIQNTGSIGMAVGILDGGVNTLAVRNNYVGLVDSIAGSEFCFSGPFAEESNNASSDATAAGVGTWKSDYAYYFVNTSSGSENLHLLNDSKALWDSYADPGVPVIDDIDGDGRDPSTPDIGADEFSGQSTGGAIYYSVGTSTDNLMDGSPQITLVGGTATLTVPQTGDIGVGDVITYDTDKKVYIKKVIDPSTFEVQTVKGAIPSDIGPVDVDSIRRAFNDIQTAFDNSGTSSYLDTFNMVTGGYTLTWVCYNDDAFQISTGLKLDAYNTDPAHRLTLTAAGVHQVVNGAGQRHMGTEGTGARVVTTSDLDTLLTIMDEYVTVQWLEFDGANSSFNISTGVKVDGWVDGIVLRDLLVHDLKQDGWVSGIELFQCGGGGGPEDACFVYNNIIYDFESFNTGTLKEGPAFGIVDSHNAVGAEIHIYNNTVYNVRQTALATANSNAFGIAAYDAADRMVENNIVIGTTKSGQGTQRDYCSYTGLLASTATCQPAPLGTWQYNMSSDDSATGTGAKIFENSGEFMDDAAGSEDLHLDPSADAIGGGRNLSGTFNHDIDGGLRVGWDMGADELGATTAVELVSFQARGVDEAVELTWETASEVDNLGFYLYRADSVEGPYERLNPTAIPGLGSSPIGAQYRYVDSGLTNGQTFYYELEDFEKSGKRERHGPISATPQAGVVVETTPGDGSSPPSRITYGDPSAVRLQVSRGGRRQLVLELLTGGFYAEPQADGSVQIEIPDFVMDWEPGAPAVPVRRSWLEAVAGKKTQVSSVELEDVVRVDLRPMAAGDPQIEVSHQGTVGAEEQVQASGASFQGTGFYPEESARVLSEGFQAEVKKALVELAPLRWDREREQLVLARRMVVRLQFTGRVEEELNLGGSRGRHPRPLPSHRDVVARLGATEKGLYGVRFEELFLSRRRNLSASAVRLSRQGQAVSFHLEPDDGSLGPGSKLYFLSEGEELNPYGAEAVYEVSLDGEGEPMDVGSAAASGSTTDYSWRREEREENRVFVSNYEAANLWIWGSVFASTEKSFSFSVSELAPSVEMGRLELWLQGVSLEEGTVYRIRLHINDALAAELSWASEEMEHLTVEYSPGLLEGGANTLTIENVTENDYSTMILDRFAVSYPRWPVAEDGKFEGSFSESGVVEVAGLEGASHLLDITDEAPRWLQTTEGTSFSFRAEAGRSYLAVSEAAVLSPRVVHAAPSGLVNPDNQADYLVIGPRELLAAAAPLLELRGSQGLSTQGVALEEIYAEFGFGEENPEAVREFLGYAYHHWSQPGPRYMVLLGDGTYDYKDYLGTGVTNQVPPLMVKSTYMWTASDPSYGAVNGEDGLPDLAIGRLPASTLEEANLLVDKIVLYETSGFSLMESVALVADNPDKGGDFEANAEEIAARLGLSSELTKIYLGRLGVESARIAIAEAFNSGVSLVSYIGHGGLDRWAHEKVFDTPAVQSLLPQPQQPLVLTLNCLNGYFHLPYYDALAEELLKAEGRGAIATFSPSGLSLNDPAHRLHKALVEELVHGGHSRLGDAILAAQSTYAESGAFLELLQLFHLLGDPALTLQ